MENQARPVKQLRGARHRARTFFERRVGHYGYSTTLSLGKAVPWDWTYVRIVILEKTDVDVTIRVEKLLGGYKYPQFKTPHKGSKQDS